jgi:hypothetical protein
MSGFWLDPYQNVAHSCCERESIFRFNPSLIVPGTFKISKFMYNFTFYDFISHPETTYIERVEVREIYELSLPFQSEVC